MDKQVIKFTVTVKDGIVTDIGRSYVSHPEIKFNGSNVKCYKDKMKDSKVN